MSKIVAFVALLVALGMGYLFNKNYYFPVVVPPPVDGYFGASTKTADSSKIIPFSIRVSDDTLDDLKMRLENSKFFEPLEDVRFEYGFNTNYLKKVRDYWRNTYDWRKAEDALNVYSHFRTEIEGLKVHFMDVRPPADKYKRVVPLLLVHGWPGSVYEFYKILPMLTDPKKHLGTNDDLAFHVIAPSIPGYAWSDAPKKKGFGVVAAARIFHKLMRRLQFHRYFCQGGDWGSMITTILAQNFPDEVIGLHVNMPVVSPLMFPGIFVQMLIGVIAPSLVVNPADYHKIYPIGEKFLHILQESGYMHIQATKPDTVGFALNDSPLGLAAYILEKFSTWTKAAYRNFEDGGLSKQYTLDDLLTNVMIYWTTNSIATSQRFYKEFFQHPDIQKYEAAPVFVPTGFAAFPNEIMAYPLNFLAYKFRNITSYTDMPRGGHFAAFEEPRLLAEDVFRFAKTV